MQKTKQFCLWTPVAFLAAAAVAAVAPVTRRGTSVLHYLTRNTLISTGVSSNAAGSLRLQANSQGHSTKQTFALVLAGLAANTPYDLTAVVGDDTNSVPVSSFTTDKHGRARLSYMANGPQNGSGHGKKGMPDVLNPLTDVHAISIVDGATQTVAYAWIDEASAFSYLVKRNLTPADTNGTAAGSVSLGGNPNNVNFHLLAGGLAVSNTYLLALNSNVVSSADSDDTGRLRLAEWPTNAPALLDLRLLQLLDASSNAVLSTTLPQ